MYNAQIRDKFSCSDNECLNVLSWAITCIVLKISGICFINVRNMQKQSSNRLRSHKHLIYQKQPVENATLPISVFSLFQHQRYFYPKFN